jgi:hypothetical protein
MTNPSIEQVSSNTSLAIVEEEQDAIIEIGATTTQNGREWTIVSMGERVKRAIYNKVQVIKNGFADCGSGCIEGIGEGCAEVGCNKVRAYGCCVTTIVFLGLVIYGGICVGEGSYGHALAACTSDGDPTSTLFNGGLMILGGFFAGVGGSKIFVPITVPRIQWNSGDEDTEHAANGKN